MLQPAAAEFDVLIDVIAERIGDVEERVLGRHAGV